MLVGRKGEPWADGIGIGGGIGRGPDDEYPGHLTFYVEVPDVEAALAQAESLGGSRLMGPDEVMEGPEIGQFNDPEGNMIGLIKSTPKRARARDPVCRAARSGGMDETP